MRLGIAGQFISVEPDRAPSWHVLTHQVVEFLFGRRLCDPVAMFTARARDDADNRWPIVGIGAAPTPLVRAPPRWIGRVRMRRTFFPRVLIQLIALELRPSHHTGRS